jgi:hypothetical protein
MLKQGTYLVKEVSSQTNFYVGFVVLVSLIHIVGGEPLVECRRVPAASPVFKRKHVSRFVGKPRCRKYRSKDGGWPHTWRPQIDRRFIAGGQEPTAGQRLPRGRLHVVAPHWSFKK